MPSSAGVNFPLCCGWLCRAALFISIEHFCSSFPCSPFSPSCAPLSLSDPTPLTHVGLPLFYRREGGSVAQVGKVEESPDTRSHVLVKHTRRGQRRRERGESDAAPLLIQVSDPIRTTPLGVLWQWPPIGRPTPTTCKTVQERVWPWDPPPPSLPPHHSLAPCYHGQPAQLQYH